MATILIVEEGPINRYFVVALLREHGHRVLEASNGDEALNVLRVEKPDLMIIDILMSNTDVCPLVLELRSEPELDPPRVLLRATVHVEAEARALAGAIRARFVPKSASPAALIAAVDAILAEPRPGSGYAATDPQTIDMLWRPVVRKLCRYTANLERLNVQLDRRVVECGVQLESVRSAMDQEIRKRLWAEHELTRANLSLQDLAMRDGLTGLYNRRFLEESLAREESRARRHDESLGVMLIDVDEFKKCNDAFGHAGGDAVLRTIGQYLLSAARGEDIVSRYGGDEFVLVMNTASRKTVWERAEILRRGAHELPVEYGGRRVGPVTLSIGLGIFPDNGASVEAVLRVADVALYRAKRAGRNRVVLAGAVNP